jgi:hypothetical protein
MVRSFGAHHDRLFRRRCAFAVSRQSSIQCAGLAIAMLLVPYQSEGSCDGFRNEISRQKRGDLEWKI